MLISSEHKIYGSHSNQNKQKLLSLMKETDTYYPYELELGKPETVTSIPSLNPSLEKRSFRRFQEKIFYPSEIIKALGLVLKDYTNTFDSVVKKRQGESGYEPAKDSENRYVNFGFQIDMKAIPPNFIEACRFFSPQEIAEALKPYIFEIENSLAAYGLIRGIFSKEREYSSLNFFGQNFDAAITAWEEYHEMPLCLGAVTDLKFESMMKNEFGVTDPSLLTSKYVRQLSGFSGLLSPQQIDELIKSGNINNILLFMRTSYPVDWLKNPCEITIPLLENNIATEAIRRRAITFNVDNQNEINIIISGLKNGGKFFYDTEGEICFRAPDNSFFRPSVINDTKEALVLTGLANVILSTEEVVTKDEYRDEKGKLRSAYRMNDPYGAIRAKPLWLHYGGYGHVSLRQQPDKDDISELKKHLQKRGPYVVQNEIPPTIFLNKNDGKFYAAISRLFFCFNPKTQSYQLIGGLLNAQPIDEHETRQGRIHGSEVAIWGQIVCDNKDLIFNPQSLNYI